MNKKYNEEELWFPEHLETPKFPSPNSCLPEEELRKLEAKIDAANELLLDLALSNERPQEARRKSFEGLMGQIVSVEIDSTVLKNENTPEHVRQTRQTASREVKVLQGRIHLTGQDFVLLRENKEEIVIPFTKICGIKLQNRFAEPPNEQQLLDIDPYLRRAITFNFGETVSSSPELIQIFFKLNMKIFISLLLESKIKVIMNDEELQGKVMDVHETSLTLSGSDETEREIPFHAICFVVL
jgi:ribosome maturation factor RimP